MINTLGSPPTRLATGGDTVMTALQSQGRETSARRSFAPDRARIVPARNGS